MNKININRDAQHRNMLVTGGAGFIGSNFVHYWLKHNLTDNLIILDSLTYAGHLKNIDSALENERCTFVKGSICDAGLVKTILQQYQINTIVNFAAESHVDRSIEGAEEFIQTNIVGTFTLLEAARSFWLMTNGLPSTHHFHHVSTDEVYGSLATGEAAFTEDLAYQPNSPYSASKAASDHLVRAYHHTYGLNVTTSNCSNNYGPYHFPEKLIPLVIINLLHDNKIPVYGDGCQIRDWLHVEDHCGGISDVINKGNFGETYNIGGNNEWKNIDIIILLCELIEESFNSDRDLASKYPSAKKVIEGKSKELILFVKDRLGHDQRYAINAEKIEQQLGFRPKYQFEEGIKETLLWYLNNQSWWKTLNNKKD